MNTTLFVLFLILLGLLILKESYKDNEDERE